MMISISGCVSLQANEIISGNRCRLPDQWPFIHLFLLQKLAWVTGYSELPQWHILLPLFLCCVCLCISLALILTCSSISFSTALYFSSAIASVWFPIILLFTYSSLSIPAIDFCQFYFSQIPSPVCHASNNRALCLC